MKKIQFFSILAAASLTFGCASCGGGDKADGQADSANQQVTVQPKTFTGITPGIKGDNASMVSIAQGDYEIKVKGEGTDAELYLKLPITLVEPYEGEIAYIGQNSGMAHKAHIILVDEDGEMVKSGTTSGYLTMDYEGEKEFEKFVKGNPGDIADFVFTKSIMYSGADYQKILDNAKNLMLVNVTVSEKVAGSSDESNDSGNGGDEEVSENQKLLDEYEAFVDKYISLIKKAANGDMTVMTEATSLQQKATSLAQKLQKANLTTADAARLTEINTKMANAANELSNGVGAAPSMSYGSSSVDEDSYDSYGSDDEW